MTTLSVLIQDQLLSDSSTIHSGDTIALTGGGLGVAVPGASENVPGSPGDPRVSDFARLDFAQGDTGFLIDTARGSFGSVRALAPGAAPRFRVPRAGGIGGGLRDILPAGSDEGYRIS